MLAYDSRGSQKESVSAAIRGRERAAADKTNDLNAQIESGRVPRYVRACVSPGDRDKSLTGACLSAVHSGEIPCS